MFRKFGISTALALISVFSPAQCKNQITLVPLTETKAAERPRNFVRFRYKLSDTDWLLVRSYEDQGTSIGPYDTGLAITRNDKELRNVRLNDLPEVRGNKSEPVDGFTTLTVTRACADTSPTYFVAMQWMGDMTSPALLFVIVPSGDGYSISALPTISGGVLDVSRSNPLHIKAWHNLQEGECNACLTRYRIVEYQIKAGKPVKVKSYITRHKYSDDDAIFDDRRRIRFVP